jgi:hypothetical protein
MKIGEENFTTDDFDGFEAAVTIPERSVIDRNVYLVFIQYVPVENCFRRHRIPNKNKIPAIAGILFFML